MEIDHAIGKFVVSGGNRRSARMAIMHWDEPQLFEFLLCTLDTDNHRTTHIPPEADDLLRVAGEHGGPHAGEVRRMHAQGMLANGEPGFWDSSCSNLGEPNEVIATNPCGEIALEAWENCNLGHVNRA